MAQKQEYASKKVVAIIELAWVVKQNQDKNDIIWWNYVGIYLFIWLGLAWLVLLYSIQLPTVRPVIFCLISLPPILPSIRTIFSWDLLTVCMYFSSLSLSHPSSVQPNPIYSFFVLISFSNSLLLLHSNIIESKIWLDPIE